MNNMAQDKAAKKKESKTARRSGKAGQGPVAVVVKDGTHGHTCPRCSAAHRDADPKCKYIGLAYKECADCTAPLPGDPFAGQEPGPGFEEAVAAVDPGDSFDKVEG